MGGAARRVLTALADLVFPRLCINCKRALGEGERYLCLECKSNLPRTRLTAQKDNLVERLFYGRFYLESGTAFLYFEKGNMVQQLLHHLKYRGNNLLAQDLGKAFGRELKGSRFEDIDVLIPVPLHPSRQRMRGYNQSEEICKGLSEVLGIQINTQVLYRATANTSQTHKSKEERQRNVAGIFKAHNTQPLEGKHIALVDDVLTTGATLGACAEELKNTPGIRISVLALAIDKN